MTRFSAVSHYFKAGSLCLIAAACAGETRDPASEEPIDPAAGLYELTTSGAGLLKHMEPDKGQKPYCLTDAQRANFPNLLVEGRFKISPYCTSKRNPREGNVISGEVSCLADPKMASGSNRFVYQGVVSEDKVRIEYQMKFDAQLKPGVGGAEVSDAQMKLALKAMERMRLVIDAKRTGDCG